MLQSIHGGNNLPQKNQGVVKHQPKDNQQNITSTHYSSDRVTLSYKNLSGEEFSVEVEHSEIKSVDMDKYSKEDKQKWHEMVKAIHEEFREFQAQSIRDIISGKVEVGEAPAVPEQLSAEELEAKTEELIDKMPEFWRPEAVSDRIVGFATAFYGQTESQGEDFYELAKSAIEEGFKLAGKDMGQLPGDIENVMELTREMVMEKLDRWAEEQGVLPAKDETAGIDISA